MNVDDKLRIGVEIIGDALSLHSEIIRCIETAKENKPNKPGRWLISGYIPSIIYSDIVEAFYIARDPNLYMEEKFMDDSIYAYTAYGIQLYLSDDVINGIDFTYDNLDSLLVSQEEQVNYKAKERGLDDYKSTIPGYTFGRELDIDYSRNKLFENTITGVIKSIFTGKAPMLDLEVKYPNSIKEKVIDNPFPKNDIRIDSDGFIPVLPINFEPIEDEEDIKDGD